MKDQNGDLKSEWILHRFLTEPALSHYQTFLLKLSPFRYLSLRFLPPEPQTQ